MRVLSPAAQLPTPGPVLNVTNLLASGDEIRNETALTSTSARHLSSMVPTSKIPTVMLDTDLVTGTMAARLCISFLGHVMFLKNQVPFPIVQLARMPGSDNTSRAAKKRHELLNSFDTLTSHLYTTFIALSTALALRGTPEKSKFATSKDVNPKQGVSRAFFAVVLGPTVGAAKSRVMVGIDGLETKIWGLREDVPQVSFVTPRQQHDEDSEGDKDESPDGTGESGSDSADSDEESASEQDSDEEDNVYESGSEGSGTGSCAVSPPPSRSPSPALSSGSSPLTSPPTAPPPPCKLPFHRVEEEDTLRAAERLLSRTLASACAEDDGQGMASEMAPTQIHVLLRAPRRFVHPSWTPRQNLCASLDSYIAEFLEGSGETQNSGAESLTKRKKPTKVEGVWIKTNGNGAEPKDLGDELAEEDELIWWSWDGKLAGFADW
ncbi:hypothetical protein PAXRUDRAFT_834820 [Paxillus rubicundulus Ve08.2h10]|uniref:Uncharacterized protein n=1 Tax=Paxillus rubicundulus Ve08.2h10 TaxID=930991 RepID=A0A0D0C422_9AGAM|nr:hypothetical protein PAXRUDRAFT_834820 [Paxillus rubicundulus Ve08.2h10]